MLLLPTKHAKTTLLNLPKIDESTFGPNAAELRSTLEHLASSDNYEVLAVLDSYLSGNVNFGTLSFEDYQVAWCKVNAALTLAGRQESLTKLLNKVTTNIGLYPHLTPAIEAVAARDLVGTVITQQEYDVMTTSLNEFIQIATHTDPNSDQRTLAMNLVLTGAPAKEAVATAKGALLR